jgi:hypothetical protein
VQISVRSSKESWKSPDGKITIWEVTDGDGQTWDTMSGKIANALGQTIEVTTRVSNKGKTYLITPPAGGAYPLPAAPVVGAEGILARIEQILARYEASVAAFSESVDKLVGQTPVQDGPKPPQPPEKDVVLTEIPDDPMGAEFDEAMRVFGGGEIVDDLKP